MQYEANSPTEYLDQLDDDWRKESLLQLREMILSAEEGLIEGMEYKMLSYGDGEKTLFHMNVQKAYVSLYVGKISKLI
ncbi:MAG: DUF1801 domain-containing protein, partial [Bacteroidetes bacterium]|nr:DUF1801 domain-containing protein [Bacteroidota bacterium]